MNEKSENAAVLAALGIKPGVLYTVVPVACTQDDCIYHADCQDNAIGLTEKEEGNFMICHDYKTSLFADGQDKKVYWKRKAKI